MRFKTLLAAGTATAVLAALPIFAHAQTAAPTVAQDDTTTVVVTARQREESLKNVPIAVTAVSGDMLRQQQIYQVKDVAALTPGLVMNSDSAGRTFVTMRGIGTTLIDTVQPGVGIFIDGVYQPNTSYLNTPLVDVARIEVLRGPQGTLFGNNTLGGAINVITQVPTNTFKGRIDAAYAGPDNFKSLSASVSGPIIKDVLQFRLGAAYHNQDNFQKNSLVGGNRNPLRQDSLNATLRFHPIDWATFTLNADNSNVFGGSVPYGWSDGPTDYTDDVPTNANSLVHIHYTGANLKSEFQVAPLKTKVTVVTAYNKSDGVQVGADGDFSPIDLFRSDSHRILTTTTGELRFDTQWSDNISTLVGVFANRFETINHGVTHIPSLGVSIPAELRALNTSQAAFGTLFWKIDPTLDLAIGIRYDQQVLTSSTALPGTEYKNHQLQPRVTLTKRWSDDLMTYASIAKGARGGGQNDPGAPNAFYKGDSVWTYELGSKFDAYDHRLAMTADIFYNDYKDYIGANALAPSTLFPGTFVAVNLNAGDVKSYGTELEGTFKATTNWRLYGNLTLQHVRVTNGDEFFNTTGYRLPGDHVLFVPDWTFLAGTNYRMPMANGDDVLFDINVAGKGKRTGSSLDENVEPIMDAYYLTNASIAWHHDNFELALFGTNIFDDKYVETYLDKSLLARAGVPSFIVHSLALQGQRARYGIRLSQKF